MGLDFSSHGNVGIIVISSYFGDKIFTGFSDSGVKRPLWILDGCTWEDLRSSWCASGCASSWKSCSPKAFLCSRCAWWCGDWHLTLVWPQDAWVELKVGVEAGIVMKCSEKFLWFASCKHIIQGFKGFAFPTYVNLIIISHLPPCQSFFRINQPSIRNVARELCATERGSGRVVIAIGHRAVGAGDEILCLAERLGAPVLTRLDAILGRQCRNVQKMMGFLGEKDWLRGKPHFLGRGGGNDTISRWLFWR